MSHIGKYKSSRAPARQRGAILVVSLIMLLVLTVLGVSSMEGTGLEMKMASNNRDRQVAMQAAEAALTTAENYIQTNGFALSDLQNGCSGASCFESTCADGLCFNGSYASTDKDFECTLAPPAIDVWEDPALDVWNNAAKHVSVSIPPLKNDAKYIIEFLCYMDSGNGQYLSDVASGSGGGNGARLYRISALGTGDTGRARVLLQSVYRKN